MYSIKINVYSVELNVYLCIVNIYFFGLDRHVFELNIYLFAVQAVKLITFLVVTLHRVSYYLPIFINALHCSVTHRRLVSVFNVNWRFEKIVIDGDRRAT